MPRSMANSGQFAFRRPSTSMAGPRLKSQSGGAGGPSTFIGWVWVGGVRLVMMMVRVEAVTGHVAAWPLCG